VGEVANVVAKQGVAKNTAYVTVSKLAKDGLISKTEKGLEIVGSAER
jgi:predicted transcriptional regulator of viral defense system